MSRFRTTFPGRHVVLPIVHVSDREQAGRNVQVARDAGADGAFLISHGRVGDDELLSIYEQLRREFDFWLGINCLGLQVEEIFRRIDADVSGVWVDDALIDETSNDQVAAKDVLRVQRELGWQGIYFGGVAFKYQRPVRNPAEVARRAAEFVEVVTTSGPGTGQAASPEKVRIMKQAIGRHPLALASGVTPENVTDYLPWVDCFLVATGISYTFEEFDPERVRDLVRIVRSWK